MTDMRVPPERPEHVRSTPDKIAAALLLKQSLEKLGQRVPSWVGELAASRPQDDGARMRDGHSPTQVVVEDVEVVQDALGRPVYLLSSEEAQRVARGVQSADDGAADAGPADGDAAP